MKLIQPRRFFPLKAAWVCAVLLAYYFYTTHRNTPPRLWGWTGETQGTTYTVKLVDVRLNDTQFEALQDDVENYLHHIDDVMSTYKDDSEISRFNRYMGSEPYTVSEDLAQITQLALTISVLSGGTFDPTFSPLFDLWGFGHGGTKKIPASNDMERVRRYCGYQKLALLSSNQLVKAEPNLQIVYNAIAPGYAVDGIVRLLQNKGLTNLFVELGGEIMTCGTTLRNERWKIGIEKPVLGEASHDRLEGIAHLSNRALATSGNYRNYIQDTNGQTYSHIFDPRLAAPVKSDVASVTVIATNCAWADALATTLFVMGPDEGLTWIETMPDVDALFVLHDHGQFRERTSPRFFERTQYAPLSNP